MFKTIHSKDIFGNRTDEELCLLLSRVYKLPSGF